MDTSLAFSIAYLDNVYSSKQIAYLIQALHRLLLQVCSILFLSVVAWVMNFAEKKLKLLQIGGEMRF